MHQVAGPTTSKHTQSKRTHSTWTIRLAFRRILFQARRTSRRTLFLSLRRSLNQWRLIPNPILRRLPTVTRTLLRRLNHRLVTRHSPTITPHHPTHTRHNLTTTLHPLTRTLHHLGSIPPNNSNSSLTIPTHNTSPPLVQGLFHTSTLVSDICNHPSPLS
jgi:hypothetical protein